MMNCFVCCNVVILCFLSQMSLTLRLATEKLFGFCLEISCSRPDLSFDHHKIWPATRKTELGLNQSFPWDPQEQNLSCPKQLILARDSMSMKHEAQNSFHFPLNVGPVQRVYGKMILSLPVDNFHELINCLHHLHNFKAQQLFE